MTCGGHCTGPWWEFMHARSTVAQWGRFLSVDAHPCDPHCPQSWNRYAYARNNPLKFVDPDGKEEITFTIVTRINAPTVWAPYPGLGLLRSYEGGVKTMQRFTVEADPRRSARPVLPGQFRDTGPTHRTFPHAAARRREKRCGQKPAKRPDTSTLG